MVVAICPSLIAQSSLTTTPIQRFKPKKSTHRVFDWLKAVELIKEHNAKDAIAGLSTDMFWTSGTILVDGKIITDSYTYLSSDWATPVIVIDDVEYDCWKYQHEVPDWDAGTKWPPEAVNLFNFYFNT